jgi:hypothetical protein
MSNSFPFIALTLHELRLELEDYGEQLAVLLKMRDISVTAIEKSLDQNVWVERGIVNCVGYLQNYEATVL